MKIYKPVLAFCLITTAFLLFESHTMKKTLSHSDSLKVITNVIRNDGRIAYSPGQGGISSNSYYAFIFLLYTAQSDDLYLLSKDTSAVLRVYSFYGLSYKEDNRAQEVQKLFEQDSTIVGTINGCIGGSTTVSSATKVFGSYYKEDVQYHFEYMEKSPELRNECFKQFRKI